MDNFKGDILNVSIFQISTKYCPILTNHTSMGILFIQL